MFSFLFIPLLDVLNTFYFYIIFLKMCSFIGSIMTWVGLNTQLILEFPLQVQDTNVILILLKLKNKTKSFWILGLRRKMILMSTGSMKKKKNCLYSLPFLNAFSAGLSVPLQFQPLIMWLISSKSLPGHKLYAKSVTT